MIVSTEDDEIADVALGAGQFSATPELASDEATDLQVFVHVLAALEEAEGAVPELLVQVRATSPVRRPPLIDLAIHALPHRPCVADLPHRLAGRLHALKMWTLDEGIASPNLHANPTFGQGLVRRARQALPDAFEHDGLVDVVGHGPFGPGAWRSPDHRPDPTPIQPSTSIARRICSTPKGCYDPGCAAARCDVGIRQGQLVPAWNGAPQDAFRGVGGRRKFELAARCGLPTLN